MWFERLTGFRERDVNDFASQFILDGDHLTSRPNGRRMRHGRFETPTLGELRQRARDSERRPAGKTSLREVVADVKVLHTDPANAGALFQVASQFNTLEMVSPDVTPEAGIDGYERDPTQGPACAIACGAGLIYRNYVVPVDGHIGQSKEHQVNCLADLTTTLGVSINMRNGYALPDRAQLDELYDRLHNIDEPERHALMGHLRIGLQTDPEVTLRDAGHVVSQSYCSAVPVAYARHPAAKWEPLARLILDATYEATLAAAAINAERTGNNTVYLTLVGHGAFANPTPWVLDAITRAMRTAANTDLDVAIVSYGSTRPELQQLLHPSSTWADPLFNEKVHQWGLRGDPHLWDELHDALSSQPSPTTANELEQLIIGEVRRLCGTDLTTTHDAAVHIERYPTTGMSGGNVDPAYWREHLIPLLISRYAAS